MEPITAATAWVAMKLVEQLITQEGYSLLRKLFFPKQKYADELYQLIEETSREYESFYPLKDENVPFYCSQPLFEALNNHVLSQDMPNKGYLLDIFAKYPNVTPPTSEQLNNFYQIFTNKIKNCNDLKKLHIEETYKEKIFDIYDEIFDLKMLLQSIDGKFNFSLDEKWFNNICKNAIADLGVRYTPELNLKLDSTNIFDGIGRTDSFVDEVFGEFDSFLIKGSKIPFRDEVKEYLEMVYNSLGSIKELYQDTIFTGTGYVPASQFVALVNDCLNSASMAEEKLISLRQETDSESDHREFNDKFVFLIRTIREFSYSCQKLADFFGSMSMKLANNPYLIVEGEAGIGKSHMLADIIESRIQSGYPTLFILGQQLVTDESPWVQIFRRFQINITSVEFLEKLNLYGNRAKQRVLIFIDAINEGNGNGFWVDNINSFVDDVREYEWVGLVMSIRTTYKDITITNDQITRNNFEVYRHHGFRSVQFDAVNLFYDHYKIERQSSPSLNPEFRNPLFLKLFCEGLKKSGLSKVPKGFHGISKILGFYVDGVNKSVASHKKYNFDPSFSLVSDVIHKLIEVKLEHGQGYIPLKKAFSAVQSVVKYYVKDTNFLRELINEGLLTKGIVRNEHGISEDVVYISFERFDDHLTVNYLLEKVVDIEAEFESGGSIRGYFKDKNSLYSNQGIVEALSVQLPEKFDKELYELLPDYNENYELITAFIDSLVWRSTDSIDFKKLESFLNENVLGHDFTCSHFLETVVSITALEHHPFNAKFLHDWLLRFPLPERDAFWTVELKYKYSEESTFRHLVDWAWSEVDKRFVSDESVELAATTICWFLTSSSRELRDCSTKALVNLLEDRIPVLVRIINKFEDVDDPHVWERIFAVTLGCTLRTEDLNNLSILAQTVYNKVFATEQIYPHMLLRGYAREILEYVGMKGLNPTGLDLSNSEPPYNSIWPEVIPSKDELNETYDNTKYSEIWRSVMGGGDFSRYTIGTNHNHSEWSGCKIGRTPIDRKHLFDCFKTELSSEQLELFGSLDPVISSEDPHDLSIGDDTIRIRVAIARKTEEVLIANKVAFKESLQVEKLNYYENEIEPYLNHNNNLIDTDSHFDLRLAERFIFNRVIELGWDPDLHGDFDNNVGTGRGRSEPYQERIGKKYQWIAYYEFMARLADNFIRFDGYGDKREVAPYKGPWEPYVRDIDPTILLKKTGAKDTSPEEKWWTSDEVFNWECSFEDWIKDLSTLNDPHGLIEVTDDSGMKWLVLESSPSWKEPKVIGNEDWGYPRKEVWCQVRSYIVKSSDFVSFKNWAESKHFMGRWMPESTNRYQLFNREYYWSEAFEFFKSDYYSGKDWVEVTDRDSSTKIADVCVTSINYLWEEEFDKSKTETLSFLKPCALIFEKMDLAHGLDDGTYVDESGGVVCFAAEVLHKTKPHLLVKKEPFLEMLKENDLEVVWTLLGEKGVIGGSLTSDHDYGRIEFSGTFYCSDGIIEGGCCVFPD